MFPSPASPGGRRARRWPTFIHNVHPQHHYTQLITVPLTRTGQALVAADGTATVSMGPSGVGGKWYPSVATFSTSTGPTDSSKAVLHLGYVSQATLVDGNVYSGGGSSAGLAIPEMTPGDLIIAVWAGATPGDTAQLTVSGTQDALVVPG